MPDSAAGAIASLAPALEISRDRHRPLAGRRHGARRRGRSISKRAAAAHGSPMPRPASTPSTWPITTAAPRSSPAAFCAHCARRGARGDARPPLFTKWCPTPGPMTADDRARGRRSAAATGCGVRAIDLLQFHWWTLPASRPISTPCRSWRSCGAKGSSAISASPISTPTTCACW